MAALAYLLLPLTGLAAIVGARRARVCRHGLQAIVIGLLWPIALYGADALGPRAAQVTFVSGAILWLGFMIATATGRDPSLPLVGDALAEVAEAMTEERNTSDTTSRSSR